VVVVVVVVVTHQPQVLLALGVVVLAHLELQVVAMQL
jgi:hypothetical protein